MRALPAIPLCAAAAWLGASPALAQPACPPAALVDGDPDVVSQVGPVLEGRGIAAPPAYCPAERARVEREGETIHLYVIDADGRSSERRVESVATAATLIESFAVHGVDEWLPLPEPEPAAALAITSVARRGAPGALGVSFETSLADDGSLWLGSRGLACLRLGPLCAGVLGRLGSSRGRLGGDALLASELPIGGPGASLTPGLGVGLGWLQARAADGSSSSGSGELGDDGSDDNPSEGATDADSLGLRVDAHVVASLPLGRALRLTFGLSLGLTPLATGSDGEPASFGRLDLGLQLGGP